MSFTSKKTVFISKHLSHIYVRFSVLNELVCWFMVFNDTCNNISVISGRSDLLVDETGVPGENHRFVTDKL